MTRRVPRLGWFLIVFLAGCADAPPSTVNAATETGTDRMVELLAQIAAGIDRQQNQFAASARVEELLAMDAGPDLPGQMMFKSRLSEMLLQLFGEDIFAEEGGDRQPAVASRRDRRRRNGCPRGISAGYR